MTRNERIIHLTSTGWLSMNSLSRLLDCPEASIRRSIQELRRDGYYVVLDQGQARCYGKRTALIAESESVKIYSWEEGESANIGGDDDVDAQK
jgi:biotin operon repressor